MEKLFVLLGAIALVILGARGTYKSVWNQFFPNAQIVTTPTSTTGNNTQGAQGVPAAPGTAGNPKGSSPITQTPNVTQTGGSNAGKKVTVTTGGGGVYPVTSVPIAPTYTAPAPTTAPSWWPSWLPYPGDIWARG